MIDIKDKQGNVLLSTSINKGSKRKFQLMKEDYVILKFSMYEPVYFNLGDGIDNEIGVFELVDLCKPSYNTETCGYDYELRLDAYYWKWKNKKLFYTPESGGREASWTLTATLKTHIQVLLRNLQALGYKFRESEFVEDISETVESSSKLIVYNNCNLIDALTLMAEAWECEWWITENIIHFGRCEYNKDYPVDFKLNDNVASMDRNDSQTKYATRIYAFGSTRNIPSTYRKKLVFDVKKVDGENIADTARPLKTDFFPFNTVTKEEHSTQFNLGYRLDRDNREEFSDKKLAETLATGIYRVTDKGNGVYFGIATYYFPVSFPGAPVVPRDYLPEGNYVFRASFIYMQGGIEKEVAIGSNTVTLGKNQQYEIDISFPLPKEFTLGLGVSQLRLRTYLLIPYYDMPFIGMGLSGNVSFDIAFIAGQSATTSVTFLSGRNEGQTFPAIYNPDLLMGDNSNILRLPEGIVADLGDRYTINNIIKSQVNEGYFSKDDTEQTINSVVQQRLMLPIDVPYIDASEDMIQEEAVEEIVVFEEVYAKYVGRTSEVFKPRLEEEIENDKKTDKKYPIYRFKDIGLHNFLERSKLDELRLVFQTGSLSGLDFALKLIESDNTGTVFEIIRNEDYGRPLPDEILFPQKEHMEDDIKVPDDTYVLYGFDTAFLSESMIPNAEIELKKKAEEYIKKAQTDPSTYNCKMKPSEIYNEGNIKAYELGECVTLINPSYFRDGRQSRIIGYECSLDIPYDSPLYTVGETAAYSRLGEIESKIDSLSFKGLTYLSGVGGAGSGGGVYVIGINDLTVPSDKNVFSSKKSLNSFLNKAEDGSTTGHITFENGILVRKQEIVEASPMALIEENDAIVEEIAISQGAGATTFGALENVSDEADDVSETNDVIVRLAGSSEWNVNTTIFSNVTQLMEKVFPFSLSLSGGGVYEKGSTQIVTLAWSYDRDITSQSVNGKLELIDIRSKQFEGVTTDTVYTLSAVYNGKSHSKSVSASFRLRKYFGVSECDILTNEEVLALSTSWAERAQMITEFDCTGGKYPYYILPTSMVSGIQFWIGGLRNTDWLQEVREITNSSGHTESYTIFRLNSIQTGVLNIEIK